MSITTARRLVVGCVVALAVAACTSQPDVTRGSEPTHGRPSPTQDRPSPSHDRPSSTDCVTATGDPAVTERRPLAAFTAIDVSVPVDIVYDTSDTPEIVLTASREVLGQVATDVASGTLRIASPTACWRDVTLTARIAGPPVTQVQLTATASLAIATTWNVERLDVTLEEAAAFSARIEADTAISINATGTSGVDLVGTAPRVDVQLDEASNLDAGIDTDALTLDATRTSHATITGTTAELTATLDEASSLDAAELTTATAVTVSTGASHATVNVSDTLTVDLDESSTVDYHGSPSITRRSIDPTSQLTPLDD